MINSRLNSLTRLKAPLAPLAPLSRSTTLVDWPTVPFSILASREVSHWNSLSVLARSSRDGTKVLPNSRRDKRLFLPAPQNSLTETAESQVWSHPKPLWSSKLRSSHGNDRAVLDYDYFHKNLTLITHSLSLSLFLFYISITLNELSFLVYYAIVLNKFHSSIYV